MPVFPKSGSVIKLGSGYGRHLQLVPGKSGSVPQQVCHQGKYRIEDVTLWIITKTDEGTLLLSPALYSTLNLTVTTSGITLVEGSGLRQVRAIHALSMLVCYLACSADLLLLPPEPLHLAAVHSGAQNMSQTTNGYLSVRLMGQGARSAQQLIQHILQ